MSAYLVAPEHIHILLWAGHTRFRHDPYKLSWAFGNPIDRRALTDDNLSEVGQMLVDANNAAVNHRYANNQPAYEYTYEKPRFTTWSLAEVVKALECYEYQSYEPEDWPASQAYAFCRALQTQLGQSIPGWANAPWGITSNTRPAAQPFAR